MSIAAAMVLLAARIGQAAGQPPAGTGHHAREQPVTVPGHSQD